MKQTVFSGMLWEIPSGKMIRLKSFTGDQWYSISLDNRTCTCYGFLSTGVPCKHLNALGIYSRSAAIRCKKSPDVLTSTLRDGEVDSTEED